MFLYHCNMNGVNLCEFKVPSNLNIIYLFLDGPRVFLENNKKYQYDKRSINKTRQSSRKE